MSVDLGSLHRILRHQSRRKIVLTLLERKEMAYTDLMGLLEVESTGKLNYHLKILGDLIEKNENGKYRLTEKGQLASQLLVKFPEKEGDHMLLRGGDAVLIGFVSFLFVVANPGLWGFTLYLIGFVRHRNDSFSGAYLRFDGARRRDMVTDCKAYKFA